MRFFDYTPPKADHMEADCLLLGKGAEWEADKKKWKEVPNAKETPLKSEIATPRRHVKRVQSEKRIGIDWLYATNGMRCKVATVAWLCMA